MEAAHDGFINHKSFQQELEDFLEAKNMLKTKVKKLPHPNDAWENFVDDSSVVENICGYLDETYTLLMMQSDNRGYFIEKIGIKGSHTWMDFQFLVIKHLKEDGCFNQLENKNIFDDDFGDLASGCDEVIQDVAFKLMEHILTQKRILSDKLHE